MRVLEHINQLNGELLAASGREFGTKVNCKYEDRSGKEKSSSFILTPDHVRKSLKSLADELNELKTPNSLEELLMLEGEHGYLARAFAEVAEYEAFYGK